MSEITVKPIAWVIPGNDNANSDGFIDAMAWPEGEFTRPLYGEEVLASLLSLKTEMEALAKALEPFAAYVRGIEGRPDSSLVCGGGKVTTYLEGKTTVRQWPPVIVSDFREADRILTLYRNREGNGNG